LHTEIEPYEDEPTRWRVRRLRRRVRAAGIAANADDTAEESVDDGLPAESVAAA